MTLFIVHEDTYKKVKNYKGLNVLPSQTQLVLGVVGRQSAGLQQHRALLEAADTAATTTLEAVVVVRESRFCLCKGRSEGEWRPLWPQLYTVLLWQQL